MASKTSKGLYICLTFNRENQTEELQEEFAEETDQVGLLLIVCVSHAEMLCIIIYRSNL